MTAVMGYQGQLGIDATNPIAQRFDFDSESLMCEEEFKDTNGLRGTRSRSHERVRQGNRRIHGSIKFQPTTNELALLLPWIMGGVPSGTGTITYPLADLLPNRFVTIDRGSKVFTYSGCVVNKATFSGNQGEPLEVEVELVGIDETVAAAGSFPSLDLDIVTQPLMFYDLSLAVAGTAYQCKQFQLVIDNDVNADRFFNSQTLTGGYPQDRHVTVSHELPYGDASAAYNLGVGGIAVTAAFSNGTHVLTFGMANVKYPRKSPGFAGREEVMLPMQGTAYCVGNPPSRTLELVTTLAA